MSFQSVRSRHVTPGADWRRLAKGRGRDYWIHGRALKDRQLRHYREAAAVRRAPEGRRYDNLPTDLKLSRRSTDRAVSTTGAAAVNVKVTPGRTHLSRPHEVLHRDRGRVATVDGVALRGWYATAVSDVGSSQTRAIAAVPTSALISAVIRICCVILSRCEC